MTFIRSFLLLMVFVALAGCATVVPFDKSLYVDEWEGDQARLLITQNGYVRYERFGSWTSTSVEGSLKGFKGDNFAVGVGPLARTLVVNKPPYLDGDEWKMIVDGRELVRVDNRERLGQTREGLASISGQRSPLAPVND